MKPVELTLDNDIMQQLDGLYPVDQDKFNNIVGYCANKVWDYVCEHSTINWQMLANNNEISAYQMDMLKTALRKEVESYLDNGGDLANIPIVTNGVKGNFNEEDVALSQGAIKTLSRAGFLYRGLR